MTVQTVIPEGHLKDAKGRLVPINLIKPIDLARDELVNELIQVALDRSRDLRDFKDRAFADLNAFIEMSAEQYNVKLGGTKGNVTLHTFDGRYRIEMAISERIVFDERLQAAKQLIDECVIAWSEDSRPEIRILVQSAFQTDKEGKINTGRVLELRRLDIEDEKWQDAMRAIAESTQVTGSKKYVRFFERVGETDQYRPISLNIAAV